MKIHTCFFFIHTADKALKLKRFFDYSLCYHNAQDLVLQVRLGLIFSFYAQLRTATLFLIEQFSLEPTDSESNYTCS